MEKVEEESIIVLFDRLADRFTDHRKVFLGQPKLSRQQKKNKLKKTLFNALFSNLTGPHSRGLHSDGASRDYGAAETVDVLGIVYELRMSGQIDRSHQLQHQMDKYMKGGDPDDRGRVLRLILQLAHSVPDPDYKHESEKPLGSGVFKPPVVFLPKDRPRLLPPGPRHYGDSRLPRNSSGYYTHFPDEVFQAKRVDAESIATVDVDVFHKPPGSRLPFVFQADKGSTDTYLKGNQDSLFGALVHSHSSSLSTRLEIPTLSEYARFNGIQVPKLAESPLDEGYESSTLTTSPSLEYMCTDSGHATDVWDEALSTKTSRYLAWENVGRYIFEKERPYLTEAGPLAFDIVYRQRCQALKLLDGAVTLPSQNMLTMRRLIADALNLLIGVPSLSFVFDSSNGVFSLTDGLTLSGLSMTSVQQACKPLLECATHYVRLVEFSRPISVDSFHYKGLIFQAFAEGIRRYLQHYRGFILSLTSDLTLMQLTFKLNLVISQLRFLAELCGCALRPRIVPSALQDGCFPTGVALLTYVYDECLEASSFYHYPMLLSLFKSTVKPYLMFITEWVFHGMHRDSYREFYISVDYDYLLARDETYWTKGYRLNKDVQLTLSEGPGEGTPNSLPMFLRGLAKDIYVCGKSINLLRTVAPQHFLLSMEHDVPRVQITLSEPDLAHLEVTCSAYRSRMQAIARQLTFTKQEMRERAERAKQELIVQARRAALEHVQAIQAKVKAAKEKENVKKRQLLSELKSQMESDLKRRTAAEEAILEEDKARMELVSRTELVEAKVEVELERQARQELIEYYAKLSEEAMRREQKALWRVRRKKLALERADFLQQDEEALLQELADNPIYESIDDEADGTVIANGQLPESELPAWAQKGLKKAAPVLGLEGGAETLPKWARTAQDGSVVEVTDDTEEIEVKSVPHVSHSTIQDVLKMSDNQTEDTQNKREIPLATDVPHVSQTSKQGLLRVDGVGDELAKATAKDDLVTVKELNEAKELRVKHMGVEPVQPKQHPSSSVIQNYMYPTNEQDLKREVSESRDENPPVISDVDPFVDAEVEKMLKEKLVRHVTSPAMKVAPKTHVRIRAGVHATTESSAEERYRPTIRPSEDGGASAESKHMGEFKPHVKSVEGMSATSESVPVENEAGRRQIRFTEGRGATVQSTEETTRKTLKTVPGAHVSEQSTEETPKFRLKMNPEKHANRESSPKKIKVFKPSIFGHVSQLSQMGEYDILVPKLKKHLHSHASRESELRTYQVISCRKKVKGRDVNERSDEVDAPKPKIKNVGEKHVSQESEFVDTDALRLQKFRQKNIHGHAADSSAQRLLYGQHYGTGQMFADTSFEDDMSEVPTTGDLDFHTNTELIPYEDNFDRLAAFPKLDLMAGRTVSDPAGELSLSTGLEDVSAHVYQLLPSLMKRSIATPLLTQIALVNENVLNYFMCELEIGKHFEMLRRYMLMEDGEFSQSLSDQLFEKLSLGPSVHQMFNPLYLTAVLRRALQSSLHGHVDNPDLNFIVTKLPSVLNCNAPNALDCLELTYRVDWPVNLVVGEGCLRVYARVFSFMLQLKRAVWTLKDIWSRLKRDSTIHKASDGAQFRQLQLFKHEMQHLVKVLQGYIANQVIEVTWQEFQDDVNNHVTSLDELMLRHATYLKHCQARCLLNPKAQKVLKVIQDIFTLILKFGTQLVSADWRKDPATGEICHPHFEQMCKTHRSFQEYSRFLFKVVSLLAARGYQPHLQELVLRLNFNGYYRKDGP